MASNDRLDRHLANFLRRLLRQWWPASLENRGTISLDPLSADLLQDFEHDQLRGKPVAEKSKRSVKTVELGRPW
jgi:hypothetical protein